jgi:hypothetical protein
VVFFAALSSYYIWQWGSGQGFVGAINDCDRLTCVFFRHYYPTNGRIVSLQQAAGALPEKASGAVGSVDKGEEHRVGRI